MLKWGRAGDSVTSTRGNKVATVNRLARNVTARQRLGQVMEILGDVVDGIFYSFVRCSQAFAAFSKRGNLALTVVKIVKKLIRSTNLLVAHAEALLFNAHEIALLPILENFIAFSCVFIYSRFLMSCERNLQSHCSLFLHFFSFNLSREIRAGRKNRSNCAHLMKLETVN